MEKERRMQKEKRGKEIENPEWVKKILELNKKKEKSPKRTSQSKPNERGTSGY